MDNYGDGYQFERQPGQGDCYGGGYGHGHPAPAPGYGAHRKSEWENHPLANEPTVRVLTKAADNYSLSVRNGEVVLAPANPRDPHQV